MNMTKHKILYQVPELKKQNKLEITKTKNQNDFYFESEFLKSVQQPFFNRCLSKREEGKKESNSYTPISKVKEVITEYTD